MAVLSGRLASRLTVTVKLNTQRRYFAFAEFESMSTATCKPVTSYA